MVFWYIVIEEIFNRPVSNPNFLGAVILILGALLIIFHRVIAKKFFTQATSLGLDSTKSLWINFGELNTQKLYLIIGIITILAGAIILLSNTFYR